MIMRFVVMGVAGCGKSSIGSAFAERIDATFTDGDDLHPPENVAKMARGSALDDDDRAPWLQKVGQALSDAEKLPHVIGCSALKRSYRDIIRAHAGGDVGFIHLDGSRDLISRRMAARKNHFMPSSLLESQFATLEPLEKDETHVRIDIDQSPSAIISELVAKSEREFQ